MDTKQHTPCDTLADEDREQTLTLDGSTLPVGDIGQALAEVDRFKLEKRLGSGGMGTVYEAWDERLQRRVALKFLRGVVDTPSGEARFFREAQGLARISHPNVVPVYDVGRFQGRVWIAMEYVPGQTLGAWVSAAPRSPDEIVEHWIAAGRGLAAIHDAGLTHRDIKPNNILVGDGRVRLIDFGLVKAADTLSDGVDSLTEAAPTLEYGADRLSGSLTNVDSFVGTPAYAAPEQWELRWIDARSDQFSFCVGLWEALCGSRPPRTERGRDGLVPLPEGARLSMRLHRALSQGLALEPRDRFADMHGLLAALAPPRRRWLAPSIAAAVTALVVGGLGWVSRPTPEPVAAADPCAEASTPVEAVWTPGRRMSLASQLGPELGSRGAELVDGWAASWAEAATTSCTDVHVHQRYSEAALDRRAGCLDRSLEGLEAMMLAVDAGELGATGNLVEWLGVIPEPEACLAESVLRRADATLPAEHAEEIASLERQLIGAGVRGRDYQARIEIAERVRDRAEALGYRQLRGTAALALGQLQKSVHELEAARASFGLAIDIGTATHDLELAADGWSGLYEIASELELDRERAAWILERETGLFAGLDPGPRRRARLLHDRAHYLALDSRLDEAEATLREALSLYTEAGVAVLWDRATAYHTLGWILSRLGRGDAALEAYAEAQRLELGAPTDVSNEISPANKRLDESIARIGAGEFAEARAQANEGLALAIDEQGPRGELVARFHVVLAAACNQLGDIDCVRTHAELADSISLIAVGPTNPLRMDVLSTVAVVAFHDERYGAAVEIFEQALAIAREHGAPDSIEVATAEANLASTLLAAGKNERAVELAGRALATLDRRLPPNHPTLLPVIVTAAEAEITRGDCNTALELLGRARKLAAAIGQTYAPIDSLAPRCPK